MRNIPAHTCCIDPRQEYIERLARVGANTTDQLARDGIEVTIALLEQTWGLDPER